MSVNAGYFQGSRVQADSMNSMGESTWPDSKLLAAWLSCCKPSERYLENGLVALIGNQHGQFPRGRQLLSGCHVSPPPPAHPTHSFTQSEANAHGGIQRLFCFPSTSREICPDFLINLSRTPWRPQTLEQGTLIPLPTTHPLLLQAPLGRLSRERLDEGGVSVHQGA